MNHLRHTTLICLIGLALIAGLVIGRTTHLPSWWLLAIVAATMVFWRRRWRQLLLIVLALTLGMVQAGRVVRYDSAIQSRFGSKVAVVGRVADDPALNDHNQLSFKMAVNQFNGRPYHATFDIYTYRLPVRRGYQLALSGKIKPTIGSSQAELSFPAIQIISAKLGWLERWRLKYFAAMRATIPEPLASFALGLLIGARALIPKTLQAQLAAVGLSHLVAVSGYNLTIIVNAVGRFGRRLGKFAVLALSLWLIAGFLMVAGPSASIQRAAVVSILTLAAAYYGRSFKPLTLIIIAAAATALVNPHWLWSDLGWQLSFAAFFGILVLAPAVSSRLGGERHGSIALACEATAAYLMTLPLILHSFGTLAPIAPVINLIVMPLVPLAILASFMAGLAGLVLPLVAGWIAWPAVILLRFIVGLVEQGAKISVATIHISVAWMVLWYGLLGLVSWLLNRPHKSGPTWYNEIEEDQNDDVGTLKMAQY